MNQRAGGAGAGAGRPHQRFARSVHDLDPLVVQNQPLIVVNGLAVGIGDDPHPGCPIDQLRGESGQLLSGTQDNHHPVPCGVPVTGRAVVRVSAVVGVEAGDLRNPVAYSGGQDHPVREDFRAADHESVNDAGAM
ncbi:hypothetical protein [Citricoccus sp.]|uniref:hypothetical protein n=1 Tax=Citricoccus sp. TaxID=1978372 RepID=UPI0028BF2588|nr:hypothetical protein [Citricoccus sp.]